LGSYPVSSKNNVWSSKMMSQKDVEEFAAMIAQMQDDKSFHPKYNKKGVKKMTDPLYRATKKEVDANKRGPNDLEEEIDRLKFKNETLHKYNQKITEEVVELRKIAKDYEKMKKHLKNAVQQFRNQGDI